MSPSISDIFISGHRYGIMEGMFYMLQKFRKRNFMNNMARFNISRGVRNPPFVDSYLYRSNAIFETLDYHVA